jgi:hypothetical protein
MKNMILGLIFVSCLTGASEFSLTTGAWSYHFNKDQYITNENNNLIAINYKNWTAGGFKNSYGIDTYFAAKKFSIASYGHLNFSALAGINYGYNNCQGVINVGINEDQKKVICPVLSPAVTYTRYEIQPSVLLLSNNVLGAALTFNF